MRSFNGSKVGMFDKVSYMNVDLPFQERVCKSFLLGFKRLLVDWGFSKTCIHFDEPSQTLSVGGTAILKVSVQSFQFKLDWLVGSWGQWTELLEDTGFKSMLKIAGDKLQLSKSRLDKGHTVA